MSSSKPPKLLRTDLESSLQAKIAKWLRSQGCFVMVLTPKPGIPRGTADIFFCYEGFYGWLEVKKHRNSPRQPGQEAFIAKMSEWSYARVVYDANWPAIQKELTDLLR